MEKLEPSALLVERKMVPLEKSGRSSESYR